MRPFKDQPIARKTLALGVLPALFALLVGILASLISTSIAERSNQFSIVDEQATFIATSAAQGVEARDRRAVTELVEAFQIRTNIDVLCVYDSTGQIFASFERRGRLLSRRLAGGHLRRHPPRCEAGSFRRSRHRHRLHHRQLLRTAQLDAHTGIHCPVRCAGRFARWLPD